MNQLEFDATMTQAKWDNHARDVIKRYGARNYKQFELEAVSCMKANSNKAYEKFAKRAKIEVKEDANIPYDLRLRLSVVTIIMTVSCKSYAEFREFQPNFEAMCFIQSQEAKE
jgi:hypothetical protein